MKEKFSMMIKLRFSLLIGMILLALGCYKDSDNSDVIEVVLDIPEVIVSTTLSGHVATVSGELLSDYSLGINDDIFEIEGEYFSIYLDGLNKKGQTIYVYKNDIVIALGTFLPIENDINKIELILFPEWETVMLDLNQNPGFSIGMDIDLDFSNTFLLSQNGSTYKDPIEVTSGLFFDENQPTVLGFNLYNALTTVEVKSGFYLNIEDQNGTHLSIDKKHDLTLEVNNIAAACNALYHLDEDRGVWVEVGEVIDGSIITSIVADGYFVLAYAERGVFVEGRYMRGTYPISYQKTDWKANRMTGNNIGTATGRWIAVLPQKNNIGLTSANPCGAALNFGNIDIQTSDLENVNFILENENENYQFLKINILDCDGNVTDQPMIHIKSTAGGNDLYSFLSGEINAWIPVCPSFQLTAYDLESGVEGPLMNWSTNIDDDFSYMTSCNNNDDGFAVIKIGGERKFFSAFEFEYSGEKSILKSTDNAIRFAVEGDDTGSFEEKLVNIYINDETFGSKGFFMDCENAENGCGINDCTITHYDVSADGWIRVSFSGNMWMRTIDPVVAGYFDVEGVIMVKN